MTQSVPGGKLRQHKGANIQEGTLNFALIFERKLVQKPFYTRHMPRRGQAPSYEENAITRPTAWSLAVSSAITFAWAFAAVPGKRST